MIENEWWMKIIHFKILSGEEYNSDELLNKIFT